MIRPRLRPTPGPRRRAARRPRRPAVLSPAEQAVVAGVCQGLTNREIAAHLGKSEFTVKNQVSTILRKFGLPSRARLIAELHRPSAPPILPALVLE